ncbi:MAG TPA: hypothetical protein VGH81_06615 [Rudaea sp.]|jgi:hypothetical protein
MKELVARGTGKEDAVKKIDFSKVEARYTHGDPFLKNRFLDYVASDVPEAAYLAETGKVPEEIF